MSTGISRLLPTGRIRRSCQGAQQLHLRFVTQVPYFVEKQRASVGRLESARLVGQSPREGPLDMTEKLRSRQIAGNGPAVDRHEGLSGPLAFPVDQLRHMLLARAARTVDQHRHIGRGHQPDVFVQLPGGVAAALDVVERLLRKAPGRTRRGLRSGFRGRRRRNIQRFTDLFQQFVGIHRFGHIVACAELHAPHGVLDFGVTRHHDHRRRDTRSRHPLQQGDAVLVRQAHGRSARARSLPPQEPCAPPPPTRRSRLRNRVSRATCAASGQK